MSCQAAAGKATALLAAARPRGYVRAAAVRCISEALAIERLMQPRGLVRPRAGLETAVMRMVSCMITAPIVCCFEAPPCESARRWLGAACPARSLARAAGVLWRAQLYPASGQAFDQRGWVDVQLGVGDRRLVVGDDLDQQVQFAAFELRGARPARR